MASPITPYARWREHQERNTPDSKIVTCPACDGSGETERSCCCCEDTRYLDCERCEGSGVICWGDLSGHELSILLDMKAYSAAVWDDMVTLAKWTGRGVETELFRHDLMPYISIESRAVQSAAIDSMRARQ